MPPAYRRLFAPRSATALTLATFFGRVAFGMTPLVLLLAALQSGSSLAQASLLSAANGVGSALTGPVQGRALDRCGVRSVFVPLSLVSGGCLLALLMAAHGGWPRLVLLALSLLAGLARPYLASAMRSAWWRLHDDPSMRRTALAFEGASAQLALTVAPVLVTLAVATVDARLALALLAVLGTVSTIVFALWAPAHAAAAEPVRGPGLLKNRLLLLVVTLYALFYAAAGALEVALVMATEERGAPDLVGLLLAALAFGTVLGALLYGALRVRMGRTRQLILTQGLAACLLALLATSPPLPVLALVLLAAGLARSPVSALVFNTAADAAPAGAVTEAISWVGVVTFLGPALGKTLAGPLGQHAGSGATFALAAGLALAGACLAGLMRRHDVGVPALPARSAHQPARP